MGVCLGELLISVDYNDRVSVVYLLVVMSGVAVLENWGQFWLDAEFMEVPMNCSTKCLSRADIRVVVGLS